MDAVGARIPRPVRQGLERRSINSIAVSTFDRGDVNIMGAESAPLRD